MAGGGKTSERLRRFVALDRDGTIVVEHQYLSDPAEVELIPGVGEGLRRLRALGLGLVVVTNQSAVGRGWIDQEKLDRIHTRLNELLAAENVRLDGIYVCPHTPDDGCRCRKPLPGLLLTAAEELGFDPGQCFVIGDKPCDVELGRGVGAAAFLVRTGYGDEYAASGEVAADFVVNDLLEAAQVIEGLLSVGRISYSVHVD